MDLIRQKLERLIELSGYTYIIKNDGNWQDNRLISASKECSPLNALYRTLKPEPDTNSFDLNSIFIWLPSENKYCGLFALGPQKS
mgnify:FL=1